MNRNIVCLAACALLFALCIFADAQQPKKVYRIGYLLPGDPISESADSEAVRRALREIGYIEGQNIAIEYRYTEGNRDRLENSFIPVVFSLKSELKNRLLRAKFT